MNERNIGKEIGYDYYPDMEYGNNSETICYQSLIRLLEEIIDRIEKIEKRLDKEEEYRQEQND
jgi:hypothetical protein